MEAAYGEARSSLSEREKISARCHDIRVLVATLEAQEAQLEESVSSLRQQSVRDAETKAALDAADRAQSEAQEARRRVRVAWSRTVAETGGEGLLATLRADAKSRREADKEIERRSAEIKHNDEALGEATLRADQLRARQESVDAAEAEATQAHEAAIETRRSSEEALRIAERAEELSRDHNAKVAGLDALRDQVAEAEAQCQEAINNRDQREVEFRAIETEHRAAGLRTHLRHGDECPVCGASIEDLPTTDMEIESVLTAHDSAVRKARELVVTVERELSALRAKFEEGEAAAKALDRRLRELEDPPALEDAKAERTNAAEVEKEAKKRLETEKSRAKGIQTEVAESKAEVAALKATRLAAEKARDLARQRMGAAHQRLSDGLGDPAPGTGGRSDRGAAPAAARSYRGTECG